MRFPALRLAVVALLLPGLVPALLPAQSELPSPPVANATRMAGSITIDGVLDEADWNLATPIDSFTQRFPAEGDPATQKTVVRILYDDERLVIGAKLYDTDPGRIIALEMKEDAPLDRDDAFGVLIDTFHDKRNAYYFLTNANGARTDARIYDEGGTQSFDWDGVWYVASSIDDEGWSVEMEIPFRMLNFSPEESNPWGLQFSREIRRNAEDVYWSPIPRNEDRFRVSRAGELHGLKGIKQGSKLTVKPYVKGLVSELPSLGESDTDADADVGVDARYSLTPNLVGVVTINTDFAETEVDEQQVNTTRFPLFFPEKREYFLESAGFFEFGGRFRSFGPPRTPVPFFSRRVGLSEESELPVPIQGGVKLVGRVSRYNLGFLSINTREDGQIPQTNFTTLRVSRDIMARSNIGVIGVSKNPVGDDYDSTTGVLLEEHSNQTWGADLNFSVLENLKFGGAYLATNTPEATKGQGSGNAYLRWSDEAWDFQFDYRDIAKDFNPEVGFVRRTGIEETEAFAGWNWRSKTAPVRRIEPHVRVIHTADQSHELATRWQHIATSVEFRDGSEIEVAYNPQYDRLDETFFLDEDNRVEVRPGEYDMEQWTARWRGDSSRRLSGSAFVEWGDFFDGDLFEASATLRARVSKYFRTSISANRTQIDLPARMADPADPNFIALPAKEFDFWLIQGRFGATFTTTIYVDALLQYNTNVEDFSTDLRFNWKYRPGSDLFVVYRERRDIEGIPMDVVDRSFTVKWTYRFAS